MRLGELGHLGAVFHRDLRGLFFLLLAPLAASCGQSSTAPATPTATPSPQAERFNFDGYALDMFAPPVDNVIRGVPGVSVQIGSAVVQTDASGRYSIRDIPAGMVNVTVTGPGYLTNAITFDLSRSNVDVTDALLFGDNTVYASWRVFRAADFEVRVDARRFGVLTAPGQLDDNPEAGWLMARGEDIFEAERRLFQVSYTLDRQYIYALRDTCMGGAGNPVWIGTRCTSGRDSVHATLAHEIGHNFVNGQMFMRGFQGSMLGPFTVLAEYVASLQVPNPASGKADKIERYARAEIDRYERQGSPYEAIDWTVGHNEDSGGFSVDLLVMGMLLRIADRVGDWTFVANFFREAPVLTRTGSAPQRPFADAGAFLNRATGGRIGDLLASWRFPPANP